MDMPATETLKVRVAGDAKRRFGTLAQRCEISTSALLRRLIDDLLASEHEPPVLKLPKADASLFQVKADRLTIRLLAADRQALQSFARARSLRETTYLAMLIRSHVRLATPLPRAALHALRESAIELRTVSTRLDLLYRVSKGGATAGYMPLAEARTVISACERLRDRTSAFIKANIQSWEAGHAQAARYLGARGGPVARDPELLGA